MSLPRITVISVSWRSAVFLHDLFESLLALAIQPELHRLLVADNTAGNDPELQALDFPQLTVLPVDARGARMSMAHAVGLNALLSTVDTPYVLIVDPDVAMLRRGWDVVLCQALDESNLVAIGAPYPGWKLGKYHDFPSPPFAFWRTDSLRALDPDWRPYGRTTTRRLVDFALRQMFWLPKGIDRYLLRLPRRQFRVAHWIERLVGVVSKDTGWQIAEQARHRSWRARLFDVVCTPDALPAIPIGQRAAYHTLAEEFELYAWNGQPFVTHRNPTRTQINFNLWTQSNVLIYQDQVDQAAQTARWRDLVAAVRPSSESESP